MSDEEILSAFALLALVAASTATVFSSLYLTRRTVPAVRRPRTTGQLRHGRAGGGPTASPAYLSAQKSSARQGGQILEYLGKLTQEFEPIATDEEIATPRGAVAIPMAIAVRGEVRVLYPVESPLSAERIDETLRRVALIRRHRFPEARIAFLSERPLPLELALCSNADNALGRLVSHAVLHVTELREGHDDATVFRQIFAECTGESLSYAVDDLAKLDRYLQKSEPLSGPITPGLRRLGNLVGRYLEWVIAGRFPERLQRAQSKLWLRLEGGDLELDPGNLALEALYSAGRVTLAGFMRDLEALDRDAFVLPREVNPSLLQRCPSAAELSRYRRPLPIEAALGTLKERRLQVLAAEEELEELALCYVCACGGSRLLQVPRVEPGCRSLSELEARLMDRLAEAARDDDARCGDCLRPLRSRDLRLVSLQHPLCDRGIDLWITLDRLPSGKFWWHLTRLRRGGDMTHYASVLAPSTFRRAFGRFFSVKEAWGILFQRVADSLRKERLRAEPGLTLHASPDGPSSRAPAAVRRSGFFAPVFTVPLPREPRDADGVSSSSFLQDEAGLRALHVFGRPPVAWAVARARPYQRTFERHLKKLGCTFEKSGLEYRIRLAGGESFRDLGRAITHACLTGSDYLGSARQLAGEAAREAAQVASYVTRARESLGAGARIAYDARRGSLEVAADDTAAPTSLQLSSLCQKTKLDDGSFERFLKMAVSQSDLGVGLDVCGCGAHAFVSKKLKPRAWPPGHDPAATGLARRAQGQVSFIYTRDCREHSHYLSMAEVGRMGLTLDDLEQRFEADLSENSYGAAMRAVRVDAHLFFVAAGFNVASIALHPALARGLCQAAKIDIDAPSIRFLATTTGSLVLGEPEAPAAAFREAAKVADSLLRESGEPFETLLFEGVLTLPSGGRGEFRIAR